MWVAMTQCRTNAVAAGATQQQIDELKVNVKINTRLEQ
jgi:hypothetical protein